ncbi:hypothetical protein PFLUV_G00066510 [Perca fluviatilis]|uniref:Uncharacterized protein n=1 Tax=Perca fluviatilis TaxID=8168 RepID=A0A6A5F9N0_PERFL|nr:hypothetical protein PFLUV_G00066510 [Perca fluviatilis]
MQTVPWPCLTVRCVPPSPTSRAPVSLKDGVGSRTPGLWLHFLGLLLSPFRTVLAPSPRRLDTKSRLCQLPKRNRQVISCGCSLG